MKHEPGDKCPSCEEKLTQADPRLAAWFETVKARFKDAHISWSFRDEKSQDEAFAAGKSALKWPDSAHNHMEGSQPMAQALDLFQLSTQGNAIYNPGWFRAINEFSQGAGLVWGGQFRSLGDFDHWQLKKGS